MDLQSDNVVQFQNVSFERSGRMIFEKLNLIVPKGKIVAIMGPSGTGKTTILKLISGQLAPEKGKVLVYGQDIHKLSRNKLYNLRKRMGMLFQNGALFTNLNVFENVAFALREHTHLSEEMIRDLVLMKLEAVGLRGAEYLMPSELSGGMGRRVALARALALDPELILYDEPFTGQDPITLGVLLILIKELNQALGLTSVIVSHDVAETASIADYIYVISQGRVMGEGKPSDLLQDKKPEVNQFLHGLPDGPVAFRYPAEAYDEDLLS